MRRDQDRRLAQVVADNTRGVAQPVVAESSFGKLTARTDLVMLRSTRLVDADR
jgi:hypothetical protein